MKRVILESPYAGDVERNLRYARAALKDSLSRGEAPMASHLLYTQVGVLDDTKPEERSLGIEAGLVWGSSAEETVVYTDLGISTGMQYGIDRAVDGGRPVAFRSLAEWKDGDPYDKKKARREAMFYLVRDCFLSFGDLEKLTDDECIDLASTYRRANDRWKGMIA